jgi:hypothetical protein
VALSVIFVLIFARRKRPEDDSSSSAKEKALLGSATSSGPVAVPKTGREKFRSPISKQVCNLSELVGPVSEVYLT